MSRLEGRFIDAESDEKIIGPQKNTIDYYDEAEDISEYLDSINFNEDRKEIMGDIINKSKTIMQYINEQDDILLDSQAFQRLSNLSIVKKYAALSIDSVSESMLIELSLMKNY